MLSNTQNRCSKYRKWTDASSVFSLVQKKNTDEEGVVSCVSNEVLAPALNSFVLWVLKNAQKQGIQRLYFLARDGYFMYQCACVLCEKLGITIDCRYLYCSRYSLRIPSYHIDLDIAMDYICRGGIEVTRRKIIGRSGIGEKEQNQVMETLGYLQKADSLVPYTELSRIRKELEECIIFKTYLTNHSREAMPELKHYLEQEGLMDEIPSALVDSGWVGSMQKTLNELLQQFGRTTGLKGFYWGLYELPEGVCKENYYCYYFSPKKGLKEKVFFSNCLFEAIFSAPHGMTLGYKEQEGIYVPILGNFSKERREFLEQTERYLMKYTEKLVEELERQDKALINIDCDSDLKIVKKLMKEFMGHPTKEEAEVYGYLYFSDDIMDDARKHVAELLNEEELCANHVVNKTLHMLGIRQGCIKESAWYEGSAALAEKHVRHHQRQYAMYKYLLYFRQSYLKKYL